MKRRGRMASRRVHPWVALRTVHSRQLSGPSVGGDVAGPAYARGDYEWVQGAPQRG
jgi:hypothetical protein